MTAVPLRCRGQATVAQPIEVVWGAIGTIPALASLVSLVEECSQVPDGWLWDLGQRGALGFNVRVGFEIAATLDAPREISFEPIGDAARWASGIGRVRLDPGGSDGGEATEVEVWLELDLDLPVPRLVAGPIGRVIGREVQGAVDDFLRRLAAQVGG